ncbi:MAG: hypothetical protein JWO43_398 [Candidatus Adlerbacteria bacterium]|nr:hypothetical protein [Candidatus Adlerbacteria bacterium]
MAGLDRSEMRAYPGTMPGDIYIGTMTRLEYDQKYTCYRYKTWKQVGFNELDVWLRESEYLEKRDNPRVGGEDG